MDRQKKIVVVCGPTASGKTALGVALARGKLPIVVGGTGLYIDNLVAGRTFAPFSGLWRQRLQDRARAEGIGTLYAQLQAVDPERAARPPRRKAHPPGPGGLVRDRRDHHRARPADPGPAPPV